jgi:hypothetical protein
MRTIAKSISGIIRRRMQPIFRQPGSFELAAALAICLAASVCSGPIYAQGKKPKAKPPAPTRRARQDSPGVKTPAAPEPEMQLESLPPDPAVENADISITAHVRASSLKFDVVPNPTVEFPGQPARDTVWDAVRENLPTPVEPGVTYRNIGIRLKITSVFRDIDRIVAEALGEVPLPEDATSSQAPTQGTPASKPPTTSKAGSPNSQPASTRPPLRERP